METILFYNENELNGYLSNYYLVPIAVDGIVYRSSEHYYQSQKTEDPDFAKRIRDAETCDEAKNLGNSEECVVRSDWKTYRNMAMMRILIEKFSQNEDLRQMLLSTGDAVLVENSTHDYYWGRGADGSGFNMLGRLLMATRDSMR